MPDVTQRRPWTDRSHAAHQRLVRHVQQHAGARAGLARHVHAAGVAVPAIEHGRDIDVQDVAVHQPPLARDTVADDVVDRGADGFRIATVIQRRGNGAVVVHEFVAQHIELPGGDAGFDMVGDHIQRLGSETPGGAHPREILRIMEEYPPPIRPAVHLSPYLASQNG